MPHLKFLDYKVTEIQFKANVEAVGVTTFKMFPKVNINIHNMNKRIVVVANVTIEKTKEMLSPFDLSVSVTGHFDIESEADLNTLRAEASSLLYPYLRSIISSLTAAANFPAYFLPIINFSSEIEKKENSGGSVIIKPLEENF